MVGDGGGSTPQFFVHSKDRTTFTGDFRHPISTSFQGRSFSLASFVKGVEIPAMSIEITQLPT